MIPVFTLEKQNKLLAKEIDRAIKEVIDSGIFILGSKVSQFEKEFASYLGVKYAVGVASGTDAISLALQAVGVDRGDEVIMPANSYPSAFGVSAIRAVPRLVDVDWQTANINPLKISKAVSKKSKAIMPVHLYGRAANMDEIIKIGRKYSLPVIEDCAQAHGALCKVRGSFEKAGGMGTVGCFSFYPTKNLGCFGDGGMIVTNDEKIYKKVKLLRMYGEEKRYRSIILGRNSRLDEVQASILLVKLKYLDDWNKKRKELTRLYRNNLKDIKMIEFFSQDPNCQGVNHLFVIKTKDRENLIKYLFEQKIQTAIHYPKPIHLQSSFSFLGYSEGAFPVSERLSEEVLSLPLYPELTKDEVVFICDKIKEYFSMDLLNHD